LRRRKQCSKDDRGMFRSNSIWRAARRSDGERAGANNAEGGGGATRAKWETAPKRLAPQMRLLTDGCESFLPHSKMPKPIAPGDSALALIRHDVAVDEPFDTKHQEPVHQHPQLVCPPSQTPAPLCPTSDKTNLQIPSMPPMPDPVFLSPRSPAPPHPPSEDSVVLPPLSPSPHSPPEEKNCVPLQPLPPPSHPPPRDKDPMPLPSLPPPPYTPPKNRDDVNLPSLSLPLHPPSEDEGCKPLPPPLPPPHQPPVEERAVQENASEDKQGEDAQGHSQGLQAKETQRGKMSDVTPCIAELEAMFDVDVAKSTVSDLNTVQLFKGSNETFDAAMPRKGESVVNLQLDLDEAESEEEEFMDDAFLAEVSKLALINECADVERAHTHTPFVMI
jgi:hypothetical protein